MAELDNRDDIRLHAARLLKIAGVNERLPTPVDELVEASGLLEDPSYAITESVIAQMPKWMARHLRSAQRKVKGIIDRRERVINVDETLEQRQRKFVKLHEVSHDILPWQHDLLVAVETGLTLSATFEQLFEREANQCAADLFFQSGLLKKIAKDHPLDITTPLQLADMFGASRRATFRHWVEEVKPSACGFLVSLTPLAGDVPRYKRLECSASEAWHDEFGEHTFPKCLSVDLFTFLSGLAISDRLDTEWTLTDLNGEPQVVRVQSFCNSYNHFVLVWAPRKEGLVARMRKRPIVASTNGITSRSRIRTRRVLA